MINGFVLMPFREDLTAIYNDVVKDVVETLPSVSCVRVDEIFTPTSIVQDIWEQIMSADFLIAELTGRNPNVFYELGIAHALRKDVILQCQDINDVPFDLRYRRIIVYSDNASGLKNLRTQLLKHLKFITSKYKSNTIAEANTYMSESLYSFPEALRQLESELNEVNSLIEMEKKIKEAEKFLGVSILEVKSYDQLMKKKGQNIDHYTINPYLRAIDSIVMHEGTLDKEIVKSVLVPLAFLGTDENDRLVMSTSRGILSRLGETGPFKIDSELVNREIKRRRGLVEKKRKHQ